MVREGIRYQIFSRRAIMLAGMQGLLLTGLGGRLYYLSVIKGESYKLRADKNRISLRLIPPVRGEIFDRVGYKIATNRQDFRVFLIPEEAEDFVTVLKRVGTIVNLSNRQIQRIQKKIRRQRKFVPITVAQQLDWETFSRVNVLSPDLPGVLPDAGMTRFYPEGTSAAHILGYVGSPAESDMDNDPLLQLPGFKVGREGLEKRFETNLRGGAGTRRVEVNAVGRQIRELKPRQDAINGTPLQLALDMDLQRFAASRLGEEAAAAVVIDIKSGELLSLASTPAYDPNDFNLGMSIENWNALLNDPRKPLINKCLSGQYPPASTFKMIVALTALEQGIAVPETAHTCRGKHYFGDRTYHCWERRGHGKLILNEAISRSCDIYFYKLAEKMSIDDLAATARKFGLGEAFDIGIDGQSKGLVPTTEWKKRTQNASWNRGETLNVSIGQGALLATPLQLAVMTARIASGRAVEPSLVLKVGDKPHNQRELYPQLDVSPLYLRELRRGMETVMRPGGTAYKPRKRKLAKLAGKTGTAQVRRITMDEREGGVVKNKDLPWNERDHALFVGYAPVDDPQVAVAVLVQHGGGGSKVAAPIARDLIDRALDNRKADNYQLFDPRIEENIDSTDDDDANNALNQKEGKDG